MEKLAIFLAPEKGYSIHKLKGLETRQDTVHALHTVD